MKKAFLIPCLIVPLLFVSALPTMTSANENSDIQYQYWLSFDSNGGSRVKDVLYINGDKISLPSPTKYGFSFAGWYFDNETFEQPFYPGSSQVNKNTKLYAKWVVKQVKVYLDTAHEGEFEPLTFNVGDTFHISSLPTNVKDKKENGLSFSFDKWVNGSENEVLTDFVLNDAYYEFHSTYGLPNVSNYVKTYSSDFSNDAGYIDREHSWIRGEMLLPQTGVGQSDPLQSVFVDNGNLRMSQMRHKNRGYGAKVALPHEYTSGLKEYVVSTTFKINDILTPNSSEVNAYDIGFGIMVGFNNQTGANVEAVVDAYSRKVRIGAANSTYAKSGWDSVTQKFAYDLPSDVVLSTYHTLKVKYSGVKPSTSSELNASYIYVYFDDVECWNTKDVLLNKNWFYSSQANGDLVGLSASHVDASIKDVILKSFDESSEIYCADFSTHNFDTFADGWRYVTNAPGSNVGNINVSGGKLNINSYFPNQTILKNQIIYSPADKVRNVMAKFTFNFNEVFAKDKYFALTFRGDLDNKYNALFFRAENGQIQIYKHGANSNMFNDWSTATALKTITNGFEKVSHDVMFLIKDNYAMLYLDNEQLYSNSIDQNQLYNEAGYVGFLSSACNVSIDDLEIYDIDKEVK